MQEEEYRGWLEGRIKGARTRIDQISRVRRLEVAFGDLDTAFDRDGMAQVVTALAYTAGDGRRGKALPAGITTRGDRAEAMATLRHAAGLYRSFRIETAEAPLPAELLPLHRPLRTPTKRKLQPTGYWLFAASPGTWDADSWFAAGERSLLYTVSPGDAPLLQVGDLGLIKRNVWRYVPSAIVAVVEVIEPAQERSDPDRRFFLDPASAREIQPRCRLSVLGQISTPLPARASPEDDAFRYIRDGIQRTTTAIPAEAFEHFAALASVTAADLIGERAARSPATTRQAEALAAGLDPKARERVSRYIERGSIGDAVKARHGGRCQICAALGADGIAFQKADGSAYAEAHHVMPVAMLIAGSLGAENIIVLCPNHHRQAHFGRFAVVINAADHWILAVDDRKLRIEKTRL